LQIRKYKWLLCPSKKKKNKKNEKNDKKQKKRQGGLDGVLGKHKEKAAKTVKGE
jgi:hypothetical protein